VQGLKICGVMIWSLRHCVIGSLRHFHHSSFIIHNYQILKPMKQLNSPFLLMLALGLLFAFSQNALAQAGGTKPELILYKHNSGPNGAEPVVQHDLLGEIKFNGLTEINNIQTAVSMRAYATGPVSPGILPANLIFRTGAAGPFDRMVITENGLVGIGTLTPAFNLHTVGNTHTTGDFFGRIHFDDNAGANDAPNTYINEAYFELKNRSVLTGGLALPLSLNAQGGLLSLAPGGTSLDHQLFFGDDGIWNRRKTGNAADWIGADWSKLLTSEDINGTPNRIAKFTAPSELGDSQLWDDGTNVGIATTTPTAKLDVNGNTRLGGDATVTSDLQVNGNTNLGGNLGVNGNATVGQRGDRRRGFERAVHRAPAARDPGAGREGRGYLQARAARGAARLERRADSLGEHVAGRGLLLPAAGAAASGGRGGAGAAPAGGTRSDPPGGGATEAGGGGTAREARRGGGAGAAPGRGARGGPACGGGEAPQGSAGNRGAPARGGRAAPRTGGGARGA